MGDTGSSTENGRFRFTEWLRGGFGQGRSGNTPQQANTSERSDEENEESDDETAPYLSRDPRKPNGHNQRTEKDLRKDDSRGGTKVCAGCNRSIGYGGWLKFRETFFHPQCFRCRACGLPITEPEVSVSESKETYHKSCLKELTYPKCDVCYQFLPLNRNGLIEYREDTFWLQKYCLVHDHDNTPRCCSCGRLEPWKAAYASLGDGVKVCVECMESAVMDTSNALTLYHAVRNFYEGLNMKLDQQIPFLLVDRRALNNAMAGQGFHCMPGTRSTVLLKEWTVPVDDQTRLADQRQPQQQLIIVCEVTAILALYGLPRLILGGELAFHLMFSCLCLRGYPHYLDRELQKGICQCLRHMWIESEVNSTYYSSNIGRKLFFERKLGQFLNNQITADTLNNRGYRAASASVNKYGLRATLDFICKTGKFPLE